MRKRTERGVLIVWTASVAVFAFILEVVANNISSADVSEAVQRQIAKLGSGSIVTPTGYLAFVFIFFILAITLFARAQVSGGRQEEAEQLEMLLTRPVSRRRWLGGRLLLATAAAVAISLTDGQLTWPGAASGGARISLPRMLTPFAHIGLVPAQSFRAGAAALMLAIGAGDALAGAGAALAAIGVFQ